MEKRRSKLEPINELHEELSFLEYTTSAATLKLKAKPVEQLKEQEEERGNKYRNSPDTE